MHIVDAQREMRSAFLGGFMGQLVSAALWLISAGLASWGTERQAILFLVIAGIFIFPLTRLGLKAIGRAGRVGPENGLYRLGSQVAIVLPLSLPVLYGAAMYRTDWFYPAFMVLLGAHYLPFVFLYGMPMFFALAGLLWIGGLTLGLWIDAPFATGGWFAGSLLLIFAILGRQSALAEERSA